MSDYAIGDFVEVTSPSMRPILGPIGTLYRVVGITMGHGLRLKRLSHGREAPYVIHQTHFRKLSALEMLAREA